LAGDFVDHTFYNFNFFCEVVKKGDWSESVREELIEIYPKYDRLTDDTELVNISYGYDVSSEILPLGTSDDFNWKFETALEYEGHDVSYVKWELYPTEEELSQLALDLNIELTDDHVELKQAIAEEIGYDNILDLDIDLIWCFPEESVTEALHDHMKQDRSSDYFITINDKSYQIYY
jgi:hypothetical protein